MTAILEVLQLGHPTLRRHAQPIQNIGDPKIQTLIEQLILTTTHAKGVGIAAPQVGMSDRVFIVASHPNPRYPKAPVMEPTAMINPKIIAHSSKQIKGWEGCLSVPGIRGLVPRYQTIEVEYTSRDGTQYRHEFHDFVARIFQHELDHLEGIIFLDRVETTHELMTEAEYQKWIAWENQSKNLTSDPE